MLVTMRWSHHPGKRHSRCATIVAMTTESLRTVRDRLSDFVDRAEREHERVVLTRNGRPPSTGRDPRSRARPQVADRLHSLDHVAAGDSLLCLRQFLPGGRIAEDVQCLLHRRQIFVADEHSGSSGPAARMIQTGLPEAAAVIEFIAGPLLQNPHRLGKQLRGELEGRYAARRGSYRIVYRINPSARQVVVLRVEHRADVYRPR